QVADGGACLGWGGEFGPLPTAECPLPPWALARRVGAGEIVFAREDGHGVLRRELVTGARVLVADRPCERCGGWKFEDEPTDDEITCGACDGTGAAGDEWCSSCGGAGRWLATVHRPCSACRGT